MVAKITTSLQLHLPAWLSNRLKEDNAIIFKTAPERMALAIELALENVRRKTGGPFGAAVIERKTGRLISCGVNLVVRSGVSHWHAEMVALALAQCALGSFNLAEMGDYELVTSVEPCMMCLGATVASGVRGLVCGARTEDAVSVGFDEGFKSSDWIEELKKRGIKVRRDLMRAKASLILRDYVSEGGQLYLSADMRM
jgi:tRNA(Arg) A34 adenosine deaminase TadA